MKNRIIILIAMALLSASCSLDEKMVSSSLPKDYYQTEIQCRAGLNACYQNLRSFFTTKNYFQVCETQTDLMYSKKSSEYNAILHVSPASPQFGSSMWTYGYEGVMRANAVYAGIERSPIKDEDKAPI